MKRIKIYINYIFDEIFHFIKSNKQFITFLSLNIIGLFLIRLLTINNLVFEIRPIIMDFSLLLIIGSFAYLFKPRKQFIYLFIISIIVSVLCVINNIYYAFYNSFVSIGMINTLSQIGEVSDAIFEKLQTYHFAYLLIPILFWYIHYILKKRGYFQKHEKTEKSKRLFSAIILVGTIMFCNAFVKLKTNELERFTKQWNREVIVESFGLISYTFNDVYQTLSPKFVSMFGYEKAAQEFYNFYCKNGINYKKNKYTNMFKGKNVMFIHLESMQNFIIDLEVNGKLVAPTISKIAHEGLYFKKFYTQDSVGTSSDTEFSLNTSLMPALSGAVFTSYYDRTYESIEHILSDMGYYTFSMHANKATMWNRGRMHQNLGYQEFYSKDYYVIDEEVGLGLSDFSFFRQSIPYLQKIEKEHKKYMGTMLMLSNHTPFDDLEHYLPFDMSHTFKVLNEETGKMEEKTVNYLENTKMGNYLKSVYYADSALESFFAMVNQSDLFNDTVFVFYGDHDAKLAKKEFNYLYNFDFNTGELKSEDDPSYINYDYYEHEINKNTPLIIWSKNKKLKTEVDYPIGTIDILPTIANMIGIKTKYSLGHDIFDIKNDNTVIFPNGNFLTSKVYYNSSKNEYKVLSADIIPEDYISDRKAYTDERLKISNDIIVYDLIATAGERISEVCEK